MSGRHYGHEPGEWFYGCDACNGDPNGVRQSKRLTDAEREAEMWRSYVINGDGEVPFDERLTEWSRVEVWHRLATHPHYDEDCAE